MKTNLNLNVLTRLSHDWLRKLKIAYVPGKSTPLLEEFSANLLAAFQVLGHEVLDEPGSQPDVLLTTAPFGEPLNWREAMLFTARRRFKLEHSPVVFTLVHADPEKFKEHLEYFEKVLAKNDPDPADYSFPGLASTAYHTLHEQGRRGGPMLALVRLLQSQTMSIRIILVVGRERPVEAYTFDLVGAYPRSPATDETSFYWDLALRIATAASTHEVTEHLIEDGTIPLSTWRSLSTPLEMLTAGRELGARSFFTEMVEVGRLVNVPALHDAVSSQYSEGCFATWDPVLNSLIATVTGSARPVEKDNLTEDELAVITGVRPDGRGALVQHVNGKINDLPSSEAVELIQMDRPLPKIWLSPAEWGLPHDEPVQAPVSRSKLHGHRGVKRFDPGLVEHAPLEPAYYHYPVSCSTEAQARSITTAFSRARSLRTSHDPRQIVFTVMPGHGVVIVEKWVRGKKPFQLIWEAMDTGKLMIDNYIPQGPHQYSQVSSGAMELVEGEN
jgi:hypothetical protein